MAACASSPHFSYYLAHPLLKLKGEYHLVKALHEQSGFGWDDMKQMVTTPPDVWDKYLEVWKAFPLYLPIEKIVEMVIATGSSEVCLASSDTGEGRSVGSEHSEGEEGDAGDEKDGSQGGIDGVKSDSEGEAETVATPPSTSQKHKVSDRLLSSVAPPRKSHHHQTGTDAMYLVSNALEDIASVFALPDASTAPTFVSTPQQKTKALQTAETEEEGLSDNEIVDVATLFSASVEKADTYLAFTNKRACRLWLTRELMRMV
ncbi:hypothetical protein K439DRAFT_1623527 [Ramaria rubella]|nr:hypothetical protein K439DRAFT_1623527 [Ramaria rubella]